MQPTRQFKSSGISRFAVMAASAGMALVTGCANFNTIDRTNTFDATTGKTIHLDVQQRLLIVNKIGKYCAEPSPDAMAAYAASLGLGASAPAKGSVSVSGGGQGSAASIGLRTQSITLMRDALYRMCEAYANGGIGDAQVVTLLNRSQDLTAVILAIEQLTGAVSANQVFITGTTNANAFATALNNSKLFEEASAHEARALKRLEESQVEQAAASDRHARAEAAFTRAQALLKTLEDDGASAEKIEQATTDVNYSRRMRDMAASNLKVMDERVALNQRAYDNAQKVVSEIAKTPDSSSASSGAGTSAHGEFSTPTSAAVLSKEATVALAGAVKDIVVKVLEKDYVIESCMSVITSNAKPSEDPQIARQERDSRLYCQELINALIKEKALLAETRVELAKKAMIRKVTGEADEIMVCIAPKGKFDPARRDQLFADAKATADANSTGTLDDAQPEIKAASDANSFRTLLSLRPHVRAAMVAVVASSSACK